MHKYLVLFGVLFFGADMVLAQEFDAFTILDDGKGKSTYSINLQILGFMTILTLLPGIVLSMTSFTRIIIVLGILRQAMGMAQTPNNQILIGLALFLTIFVMAPVFNKVNEVAISPYLAGEMDPKTAVMNSIVPMKEFMLTQTRENDLSVFRDIANKEIEEIEDIPLSILLPSFVTSELKTAFQIGFFLFIPFLVIDLVVASILMAMGMMMLSPLIISLPFKIMLFILVDGWALVMSTLAGSFGV